MDPTNCTGHSSSGTSLVGSSRSMPSKVCSGVSGMICRPSSHSGNAPAWMAFHRSRRCASASIPHSFCASSHTRLCTPSFGFQWNFTSEVVPSSATSRKVWTPKPSMVRYERGMARSDITQSCMCVDSGRSDAKSQNVSCADAAWGISRSGSGFTAWIRSGNMMPSWMKKTGMLLPTRSKLPSSV